MYDFKKVAVLTENCCKYFFNAKSNQEEIGVYFGNNKKKLCLVAPQVKSEKEL